MKHHTQALLLMTITSTLFGCGAADKAQIGYKRNIQGEKASPSTSPATTASDSNLKTLNSIGSQQISTNPEIVAVYAVTTKATGAVVYLLSNSRYIAGSFVGAASASGANLYNFEMIADSGLYSQTGTTLNINGADYSTFPQQVSPSSAKPMVATLAADGSSLSWTTGAASVSLPRVGLKSGTASSSFGEVIYWGYFNSDSSFTSYPWTKLD